MLIIEDKIKITQSNFVFNLIKPKRTSWHRHYTIRCMWCNTYVVYFCDRLPKKPCDQKAHSVRQGMPNFYRKNDSQLPKIIRDAKRKFLQKGFSDCNEHFYLS